MLAGARGQSGIADWAKNYGEPWRTRLGFTHPQGPSQSTVRRVFARIAVETLEAQLARWMQQVVAAETSEVGGPEARDGVAMDGKTLWMSAHCGATDAHLLSLFNHHDFSPHDVRHGRAVTLAGVGLGKLSLPAKK